MNLVVVVAAIAGLAVGLALGASATVALDDNESRAMETAATPTPCENFEQASAFLVGSGSSEAVGLAFDVLDDSDPRSLNVERVRALRAMFDRCAEYAGR